MGSLARGCPARSERRCQVSRGPRYGGGNCGAARPRFRKRDYPPRASWDVHCTASLRLFQCMQPFRSSENATKNCLRRRQQKKVVETRSTTRRGSRRPRLLSRAKPLNPERATERARERASEGTSARASHVVRGRLWHPHPAISASHMGAHHLVHPRVDPVDAHRVQEVVVLHPLPGLAGGRHLRVVGGQRERVRDCHEPRVLQLPEVADTGSADTLDGTDLCGQ